MRKSALILCAAGLLAASSMAQAQQQIPNGDFGGFTMGTVGPPDTSASNIPNGGWIPTTANGTLSSQSSNNSPFINKYANNSSSWLMQDATTSGYNTDPSAYQAGWAYYNFTPLTTAVINFDFKVGSIVTGATWGVQLNNSGDRSAIYFQIDDKFVTRAQGGAANTVIASLTAGTWYNVQATINITSATTGNYSGTITPDGSSAVPFSFSDINMSSPGSNNFISGIQVRDRAASGTVNADLFIDNLSLVPEPASLSLLALGGLFLGRRRK